MLTLNKAGGSDQSKVVQSLKDEVENLTRKLSSKNEQAEVNREFESALQTVRSEKDELNKQIEALEGKLATLTGELAQRDEMLLLVKGKVLHFYEILLYEIWPK